MPHIINQFIKCLACLSGQEGWESVASCAKKLISNSHYVPSEVKAYYQKSKSKAIISRCKRCVANIHVVNGEESKSDPHKHQNRGDSDNDIETNKKERASKKKQKEPQKFASAQKEKKAFFDDSSSDEWSDMKDADIQDPKDRRRRARIEKRKRKEKKSNGGDDDDGSDSDEPQIKKKDKSELQREALEKHSLMCDAALSTMQKMQGLFDINQSKI